MQLGRKRPAVNLQSQIKEICLSVALTILLITTIFMVYNQYVTPVDFIDLNNSHLFFVIVGSNTLLILLVFLFISVTVSHFITFSFYQCNCFPCYFFSIYFFELFWVLTFFTLLFNKG